MKFVRFSLKNRLQFPSAPFPTQPAPYNVCHLPLVCVLHLTASSSNTFFCSNFTTTACCDLFAASTPPGWFVFFGGLQSHHSWYFAALIELFPCLCALDHRRRRTIFWMRCIVYRGRAVLVEEANLFFFVFSIALDWLCKQICLTYHLMSAYSTTTWQANYTALIFTYSICALDCAEHRALLLVWISCEFHCVDDDHWLTLQEMGRLFAISWLSPPRLFALFANYLVFYCESRLTKETSCVLPMRLTVYSVCFPPVKVSIE